jgi:hypothetical protein
MMMLPTLTSKNGQNAMIGAAAKKQEADSTNRILAM